MAKQYAVVAYVRNSVGNFVEELRRELYPQHAHLAAHVTVLPPRSLKGTEEQAISALQEAVTGFRGFHAALGDVENFFPITPTVFLRVARAAYRFREIHDALNVGAFESHESWPYMPHLTIVKMPGMEHARQALQTARERWRAFHAERTIPVEELTFVREGESEHWEDIATIPLGNLAILK